MRAVVVAVVLNFHNLFVLWAPLPALWGETMSSPGTTLARHILARPEPLVYVSRAFATPASGLLWEKKASGNLSRFKDWNPDYWNQDTSPPLRDVEGDATVYCRPLWEGWLRAWYPNTKWTPLRNRYGDVYSAQAEIPNADIEATFGMRRVVLGAGEARPQDPMASRLGRGSRGDVDALRGLLLPSPGRLSDTRDQVGRSGQRVAEREPRHGSGRAVLAPAARQLRAALAVAARAGKLDELPELMLRWFWARGAPIPIADLSPAAGSELNGLRGRLYSDPDCSGEPERVIDAALPRVVPSIHRLRTVRSGTGTYE